jgi:D-3-phosphoglycerate dehydrogenase
MTLVVKTDGFIDVGPAQLAYFDGMGIEFVERTCLTEPEMIAACAEADALMVLREPVNRSVIGKLRRCKVIGRFGVGLDTIDVPAATEAGIRVTYVPDANFQEVAAHALAMMLALVRRLPRYDRALRGGHWRAMQDGSGMRRLDRLTLGIVGYGRIGRDLARKAKGLGLTVAAYDPHIPAAGIEADGVRVMQLDALIAGVDILTLHVPLSATTRNMIDAAAIATMKPGAVLINVSRGGLVDEAALAAAIADGRLAGAGIDTFATEPPDASHPLFALDNVIVTPHAAHFSVESYDEVRNKVFADVAAVLRGQEPLYPVNAPARR